MTRILALALFAFSLVACEVAKSSDAVAYAKRAYPSCDAVALAHVLDENMATQTEIRLTCEVGGAEQPTARSITVKCITGGGCSTAVVCHENN